MATIVLSAAGAAIGGAIGGSVLGVSAAVIGKAVGATIGSAIDQSVFGFGNRTVESGRIDSFRLQGAAEGQPMPVVFGRTRIAGHMIWSSDFLETKTVTSSGGKGTGPKITTKNYTYSVSVAFALGEGVVSRIGRIWADGQEISTGDLNIAFYPGDEEQLPDPTIAAVEGLENTPSYRGTAYVVIEGLQLEDFGNRIPQLNFEVYRPAQPGIEGIAATAETVNGVCLIPGTGEFSLGTTPVYYTGEFADNRSANVNTLREETDFLNSLDDLHNDLPNCKSISVVTSWFGDDLRCGYCTLRPKVEKLGLSSSPLNWQVNGLVREEAQAVSLLDGRPVFGGTPSDNAVIEALQEIKGRGFNAVFYPFILMDIMEGNMLSDPYSENSYQPAMPWRGRITSTPAAVIVNEAEGATITEFEVDRFFGSCLVDDFDISSGAVLYEGPDEWSYRRMILHYAHLCKLAGGVDAFLIGSEMRGLTQIRKGERDFPAVVRLKQLAADVRAVLGPDCRISYAADWSEYFGFQPADGSGDVFYHLDALWSDENIDFIGIDNYMPLSDWRDTAGHLDASYGSIYNLDYLKANIEGGEGFDWYYASDADRVAQVRTPITDGAYNLPWIYRYKDIRSWWSNPHYERLAGVQEAAQTGWLPESKPVWFTEFGFPSVDKGTNQPNVFYDPKSSESAVPYFSNGRQDTTIQRVALRAISDYWGDEAINPVSSIYQAPMIDMQNASVWAWDARPWPDFPLRTNLWSDGANYALGHWLNGRFASQELASVVAEICVHSDFYDFDVSRLRGTVTGFVLRNNETARQSLQSLMLAYDFSSFERNGILVFENNADAQRYTLVPDDLAVLDDLDRVVEKTRSSGAEVSGRTRFGFWDDQNDYQIGTVEAYFPSDALNTVSQMDLPLVFTKPEGAEIVERWLSDSNMARESVRLAVPPSLADLAVGDIIDLADEEGTSYRVERAEEFGARIIDAVHVERSNGVRTRGVFDVVVPKPVAATMPVHFAFLDVPILSDATNDFAPLFAATANPWPGGVAVYSAASNEGYELSAVVKSASVFGRTLSVLDASEPSRFGNTSVEVSISAGSLSSKSQTEVLNGANSCALRVGSSDDWEILQFLNAELLESGGYRLSGLLRGQRGTEHLVQDAVPVGSEIVFLSLDLRQLPISEESLGLEKFFRVGPSERAVSDSSFASSTQVFRGVGQRPYSPVHLSWRREASADLSFNWIRRTRTNGDSWNVYETPLGEVSERYLIRVSDGVNVLRETEVTTPNWVYTQSDQTADGATGTLEVQVAQISQKFGPGPFNRIVCNV